MSMTAEQKAAHDELLAKVKETASTEIEQRGYQNKEGVEAIVNKSFEGLDLEALRGFDTEKVKTQVREMAGEIEKLRNKGAGAENKDELTLKRAIDAAMGDIQKVFTAKQGIVEITLNKRAAAVMTTQNTIEYGDPLPDDLIESFSMSEYIPKRYGNQFIGDIADRETVANIEEYKTWLEEGDIEGAFAIVAEGALKPLVSANLVRNISKYQKLAGKYVVTEEFAKFRQYAFRVIRQIIQDKMYRDYDALLTAALIAQAAGYTGTTLDGTIAVPNDYDAIGAVAAQIESLNFMPDVLVLNPQDKWRIRLSKDSENRYLFPVVTTDGIVRMFEFRVVTSTYMPAGSFILGESGLFKIEEEAISIRMGHGIEYTTAGGNVTSVSSDIDHNRFRVILETYFHAYIGTNNLGSFVMAEFDDVKTALEAA